MSTSLLGWTDGSGKNWETVSRTRTAVQYENPMVVLAEPSAPTFTALATSIVTTTGASHLIMLQADGTNYTRIKRIYVEQVVGATTATLAQLQILRVSTAGTGGSAITARPMDAADTAYAGTIATLPTVKGTEGVMLLQKRLQLLTTAQVAATTVNPPAWEWRADEADGRKAITLGVTSTDGIVLKIVTGIATSTLDISITFTTDTAL